MSMQKEIGDELLIDVGWDNGNTTQSKRYWIRDLYPCQKLDKEGYGARIAKCPSFNPKKCDADTDA